MNTMASRLEQIALEVLKRLDKSDNQHLNVKPKANRERVCSN